MFNVCPGCGVYGDEKVVRSGNVAVCQFCYATTKWVDEMLAKMATVGAR